MYGYEIIHSLNYERENIMSTINKNTVADSQQKKTALAVKLVQEWSTAVDSTENAFSNQLEKAKLAVREFPEIAGISWAKLKDSNIDVYNAFYSGFMTAYFSKKANVGKIGKAVKIAGLEKPVNISIALCIEGKTEIRKKSSDEVAQYLRNDDPKKGDVGILRNVDSRIIAKKDGEWLKLQADIGAVISAENSGKDGEKSDSENSEKVEKVELSRLLQSAKNHWEDYNTLENSKSSAKKPLDPNKADVAKALVLKFCRAFMVLEDEKLFGEFTESQTRKFLNDL